MASPAQRPMVMANAKEKALKLWDRMDEMVFESDKQWHESRTQVGGG